MTNHTNPVIARSKATWQSIFQVVQDERWIASPSARNDSGRLAMTPIPVIARSKATWQSTPTPSLRGAKRRGNLFFRWCETTDGLLRLRLAMTLIPVIARSETTWQSTPTPSLRGVKRRGNPHQPRHCEEQSDVAIYFSGGAKRQMGCFAFGSQ